MTAFTGLSGGGACTALATAVRFEAAFAGGGALEAGLATGGGGVAFLAISINSPADVPETAAHHQAQAEIIAGLHRHIWSVANLLALQCLPNTDTNGLAADRRPCPSL